MRLFDFSSLAADTEVEVVVAKNLCLVEWTEVVAMLRIHDKQPHSDAGGGQISLILEPSGPTCDDPSHDFVPARPSPPTDPSFTMPLTFDGSIARPHLLRGVLPFSPTALRVTLRATRPAAVTQLSETLSVDIVAKSKE